MTSVAPFRGLDIPIEEVIHMGRDPGQVGDSQALVKQEGERIDALYNFNGAEHDHLVSNDGINAAYLRENGEVIVDNSRADPYPG